jgi:hypothetical protein
VFLRGRMFAPAAWRKIPQPITSTKARIYIRL